MREPTYRDGLRKTTRDIAHTVLSTSGLKELQARKVAAAAGCSVGTLYNLWRNLDELIIAANALTLDELGGALRTARDETVGTEGLEPRLLALANAYVSFAVDRQNAWRAVFDHRLASGGTVPDWYRAAQTDLFAIVEDVLGSTTIGAAERTQAARALFGAVHGIVALALDEKLGFFDRAGCEQEVRFIVSAAARGLASSNSNRPTD